jgi:hypothetical protein
MTLWPDGARLTRYECPIESCEWVIDSPGPDPFAGRGATIEEAAADALRIHFTEAEPVLREHLESHTLLEWVQEVMRLRYRQDSRPCDPEDAGPGPANGAASGIISFDLGPPGSPGDVPLWTPFRDAAERAATRRRYAPPPLADGFVRVELEDDYYTGPGWNDWDGAEAEYPARVFDIPAGQAKRWRKARDDYAEMQAEIAALRSARLSAPGFAPEGWALKSPGLPF